jgi:hypothetical protein
VPWGVVEYSANGAKRAALDDACGSCRDGITVGFPLLDYDKVRDKALDDEPFKDMAKSCIDVYTGEAAPTFNRQGVWSRVRCGVTAYKDVRRYSGADFKKAFGYTPEELNMPKYRIKDETGKDVQQVVLADEDAPGARMRVWYEMVNDKEEIVMHPDTCLRGTQADEVMKWLQEKKRRSGPPALWASCFPAMSTPVLRSSWSSRSKPLATTMGQQRRTPTSAS